MDDRNVLIRCWRGLGDAIQFLRYAPLVRLRASSLTVEAPRALLPLFQTINGIDRLIELDHGETETKDLRVSAVFDGDAVGKIEGIVDVEGDRD